MPFFNHSFNLPGQDQRVRIESVKKRYLAHRNTVTYSIDPKMDHQVAQKLISVCSRTEFRPLLREVFFEMSKEPEPGIRVWSDGKIIIKDELLMVPSLAAFYIRFALEVVILMRTLANPSDPSTKLAIAVLSWHTAVFYLENMAVNEKDAVNRRFPDWMKAARSAVLECYRKKVSPVEIANGIGNYLELLISFLDPECPEILNSPDSHWARQQAYKIASKAFPLAVPCEKLLTTDGDTRLLVNEETGLNVYGCSPKPRPEAITFSSCTATSISEIAFDEAERCRQSLFASGLEGNLEDAFLAQTENVREDLTSLLNLLSREEYQIILTSSGTYAEFYPLCFSLGLHHKPVLNILISPEETGKGTVYTAGGMHFQNQTPLGIPVTSGMSVQGISPHQVRVEKIHLRNPSGSLIPPAIVDQQFTSLVSQGIANGAFILVHILDSSKTGLGAPRLDTVLRQKKKHGNSMMVIVDAAQMRLGKRSLEQYLAHGFIVLITGSKFFTGPPFAGAILLPPSLNTQIDKLSSLPLGMGDYCTKYDLPIRWKNLASTLSTHLNLGLLLRWKAALWEMRAFNAVPNNEQFDTLRTFETLIYQAIQDHPNLEIIPAKPFIRDHKVDHWEQIHTIFSFIIKKTVGKTRKILTYKEGCLAYHWLNRNIAQFLPPAATEKERRLAEQPCHIGQPVRIQQEDEKDAMVLRLASGARLVSGVHFNPDPVARLEEEIHNALLVLDKLSLILRYWNELSQSNIPVPINSKEPGLT